MRSSLLLVGLGIWITHLLPTAQADEVKRVRFSSATQYLSLEILDDDVAHFEFSAKLPGPKEGDTLYTSPMVAKHDYTGPTQFTRNGNVIETAGMKLTLIQNGDQLCLSLFDKRKQIDLTELCPESLDQDTKSLRLDPKTIEHIYGLGQHFSDPTTADGDWVGRTWDPGPQGNEMRFFSGGAPTYIQIPVLYALGKQNENYALFLDDVYRQHWDFINRWWRNDTWGDQIRGYLMTGADLPALRSRFMELVGRPLVPPKKVFGLWVSEFGYRNWGEVDSVLSSLRDAKFPVDGFAMDLQWYGGTFNNPDFTRMGVLQWDEANFPNPTTKIHDYANQQGIDLMLIEQSYVCEDLHSAYDPMRDHGYLARKDYMAPPVSIATNTFWGGRHWGMIDWTNNDAADFWHDFKRQPLIDMGIHMHWTDLGEPEMYDASAHYAGVEPGKWMHGDVHNIYNFKWLEGIRRGYDRHGTDQRAYMMARAGAAGMQRFGAGMWSGDIGSNLGALKAHINSQMHMSFSGIDYYSSDIGGFHRESLDGDINELYTQWFAIASLMDFPVRPHVWNLDKNMKTAPSQIGWVDSNRDNLRLRYRLAPYYYSLAHRAHLFGEPIVTAPVFYYQGDSNLRSMGNEKLIGRDLLFGVIAGYGQKDRDMYLPKGDWFNFYSGQRTSSQGQNISQVSAFPDGKFKLPLFARAGAILPMARVDDATWNVLGKRSDARSPNDLIVRVYPLETPTSFTLYEDDGKTQGYQKGEVRTTELKQQKLNDRTTVTISASTGSYTGAPDNRDEIVEWVGPSVSKVAVNKVELPICTDAAALDQPGARCYFQTSPNLVTAKFGNAIVQGALVFEFFQ